MLDLLLPPVLPLKGEGLSRGAPLLFGSYVSPFARFFFAQALIRDFVSFLSIFVPLGGKLGGGRVLQTPIIAFRGRRSSCGGGLKSGRVPIFSVVSDLDGLSGARGKSFAI